MTESLVKPRFGTRIGSNRYPGYGVRLVTSTHLVADAYHTEYSGSLITVKNNKFFCIATKVSID